MQDRDPSRCGLGLRRQICAKRAAGGLREGRWAQGRPRGPLGGLPAEQRGRGSGREGLLIYQVEEENVADRPERATGVAGDPNRPGNTAGVERFNPDFEVCRTVFSCRRRLELRRRRMACATRIAEQR